MSNLVKFHQLNPEESTKRVIDSSEIAARKIEASRASDSKLRVGRRPEGDESEGFVSGLMAEEVDTEALFVQSEDGDVVMQQPPEETFDEEAYFADVQAKADEILAQAQEQANAILEGAHSRAEEEAQAIREHARQEGYEAGSAAAGRELEAMRSELQQQADLMEAEYARSIEEMEPALVEVITDVFEHVFRISMSRERDLLLHLIEIAISGTESSSSYLIHVSRQDYADLSARKSELVSLVSARGSSLEIIEDAALAENDCLIEADGGIFDCSLDTELNDLIQKLRLLSFERGQ